MTGNELNHWRRHIMGMSQTTLGRQLELSGRTIARHEASDRIPRWLVAAVIGLTIKRHKRDSPQTLVSKWLHEKNAL